MNMKTIYRYIITAAVSSLSMASCDYLDIVPDNTVTEESKWADRNTAERTLATCYANLPRFGSWNDNPSIMGAAELIFPNIRHWTEEAGMKLVMGRNSSTQNLMNYWEGSGGCYAGIRECNDFLAGIDRVQDLQQFQKERMKAEVKMIKAYLHFYLLRWYGPICPMRTNPPVDQSTADNKVYRQKVDDCFAYVIELLDEVIDSEALPLVINNKATELGRFTQAAAYFLKARVLLYWASPLFNGNTDYVDFLNEKGEPFFNQTPDPSRWRTAAEACSRAIEVCTESGIRLYTEADYRTRSTLSDEMLKVNTLRSSVTEIWNCELVWGATHSPFTGDIEGHCFAILEGGTGAWKCSSSLGIPFSLVNEFYTRNGLPVEQDKDYHAEGLYDIYRYNETDETFNEHYDFDYNKHYVVKDAYNPGMNFDREPRFYATFGFNRGVWFGNYYNDPADDRNIEIDPNTYAYPHNYFGEFSSVYNSDNYNPTGYWAKKLVSFYMSQTSGDGMAWGRYPYPDMRYADLLLMAAEAWNEVEGPSARVYGYIDEVRHRAGLKGIKESYALHAKDTYKGYPDNKDHLREIIRRERAIELACEGSRYWDELRWKTAEKTFNRILQGWNVLGNADGGNAQEQAQEYYIPTIQFIQEFNHRDYFAPIPDAEIQKNPNLKQNPNW